jgi:FkbH-like protein
MADTCMRTWQVRLVDRFGDNGVVALMAVRVCGEEWALTMLLMSCRVLGRRLEEVLLNLLGAAAVEAGAKRITGVYKATAKNGMVAELLGRWGFGAEGEGWSLSVADFVARETEIEVVRQA